MPPTLGLSAVFEIVPRREARASKLRHDKIFRFLPILSARPAYNVFLRRFIMYFDLR